MTLISTQMAPQAIGPYSQAVRAGNLIYTSGQIALSPDGSFIGGDIIAQAKQALENLKNILEFSSSSMSDVIKTTVFLVDMQDFEDLNKIYAQYFGDHKPARSTIAVKKLPKNALVEIECVAEVCKTS